MDKVEVTYKGRLYTASYSSHDGMVTVRTMLYGEKTTQLGSLTAGPLAAIMLREILREADVAGSLSM